MSQESKNRSTKKLLCCAKATAALKTYGKVADGNMTDNQVDAANSCLDRMVSDLSAAMTE